jgi:short-subunit dehydrogenase
VASFLPRGTYSAAKAWVNSFSEWAAYEYRDQGVTITCLCPGFTRTEFHQRMDVSLGSAPEFLWLDADELVADALSVHAKGKVYSIPGRQYKVITRAARIVPTPVLKRFQSLGRR